LLNPIDLYVNLLSFSDTNIKQNRQCREEENCALLGYYASSSPAERISHLLRCGSL